MAKDQLVVANLFAAVAQTPAVQSLAQRLESGGALACLSANRGAQPFVAVVLRHLFPQRPIVAVADGLKTQESFFQDVETWLQVETAVGKISIPPPANCKPLFYPAWEVLPHEAKMPHVDVVSERLETLVALSATPHAEAPLIVTSVAALLQRTFAAETLRARTRRLQRGDRIVPLDLVEWLEEQGYEPEAQVTRKGELALRGGILDLFPLTSPWPVRDSRRRPPRSVSTSPVRRRAESSRPQWPPWKFV